MSVEPQFLGTLDLGPWMTCAPQFFTVLANSTDERVFLVSGVLVDGTNIWGVIFPGGQRVTHVVPAEQLRMELV